MKITLSEHALEQARERGISIAEIRKTVQMGAKHLQHPNKLVADFMHIRVVYRNINNNAFVITVMIRT